MNNSELRIGDHISLSNEYLADNELAGPFIYDVVDYNANWGFRVAPIAVTESGQKTRDYRRALWIDADSVGKVYA